MKRLIIIVLALLFGCQQKPTIIEQPRKTQAKGFVYVDDNRFFLDGEPWFPLMLNYRIESNLDPVRYYGESNMEEHFKEIEDMGFNCVRVCMDVIDMDRDTAYIFNQVQKILNAADKAHLKVMALIRPPFDEERQEFTKALLQRFSKKTTLWAYDFFNEPLYFDPMPVRPKEEAIEMVKSWQKLMETYAPNQLFTIGFSEPIEVFEWDASLLPVDFVEVHTYHPMRVASEMYWYAHYIGRPWMVGETALPADNIEVSYEDQAHFLRQSFSRALDLGACGYGWWEYYDCPTGINFEAQYAGLRTIAGEWKPAAHTVKHLSWERHTVSRPGNFYNMLLYKNISTYGEVVDETGSPIEGAVIRGWNSNWSVGMNTYSDSLGRFSLVSNDLCVHFEVSAPGYSRAKFNSFENETPDFELPNSTREYQQIPLLEGLDNTVFFQYSSPQPTYQMGPLKVELTRLPKCH